jgi:hypothetical protein
MPVMAPARRGSSINAPVNGLTAYKRAYERAEAA